jgi:hypothetical protein
MVVIVTIIEKWMMKNVVSNTRRMNMSNENLKINLYSQRLIF